MSETRMVERVARALAATNLDFDWRAWQDDARLAIQAMREPTDAMIEAGWPHTADPCWQEDVGKTWSAMIDAALAVPEEGREP